MPHPPIRFHHGGVSVPDLDSAIAWYERVLGFELEVRFHIAAVNAAVAFVRRGALRFELFEVAGAKPLPADRRDPAGDLATHGNKHLAFQIANLDEFLVDMEQRGANVAMVVSEEFGRGCFIHDCAGNLIEFVE